MRLFLSTSATMDNSVVDKEPSTLHVHTQGFKSDVESYED